MPGNWGLIDLDTPKDVYTKKSYRDGSDMQLVFSDEFNTPGRSFYPGDDPYWEASDLHYWAVCDILANFIIRSRQHSRRQTTWSGMTQQPSRPETERLRLPSHARRTTISTFKGVSCPLGTSFASPVDCSKPPSHCLVPTTSLVFGRLSGPWGI
jgi:hypothetical protein